MPLNLDRRNAQIGSSINTRTEKHGTEDVVALDIPLSKICLSEFELGEVLLNPRAHKLLYKQRKGQLAKPALKVLGVLPFASKVAGVNVTLYLDGTKLKLAGVSLTTLKLELNEGGVTWWHFKIQCTPDLDETIEALLGRLNQQIEIELQCENYGAQPDLFERDEDGDDDDEEQSDLEREIARRAPIGGTEMSGLGKTIERSARRRERSE